MTRERGVFYELHTNVHRTICFGDGSVVAIEACSSTVFECRMASIVPLTGLYYILKLQANIVSLSQWEGSSYHIVLDIGVLIIQEPGRKLLSQVKRSSTHLYMLELKIGHPVCLSTQSTEMAWCCHS
jgi:hypothetical protein